MSTRAKKTRAAVATLALLGLFAGGATECGQAPGPAPVTSAGPANVERSLGDLPPGESVTIVFRVTVNEPLPAVPDDISEVANQGTVSGANFADVLTDDPDTAAPDDPTVTPIAFAEGDLNRDGVLDFETDSPLFFAQFGSPVSTAGSEPDYDGDGFVGHADYGIFVSFF